MGEERQRRKRAAEVEMEGDSWLEGRGQRGGLRAVRAASADVPS